MESSAYESASLEGRPNHIRILELHPGQPGDPFKGSLQVCPLEADSVAQYIALSYTWGLRTSRDTTIQLGAGTRPVEVWANLAEALDTLRRTDVPVLLWIDALCIDQSSAVDKNVQLPLMGQIYYHASKTVIWLGTASDNSARAMECVRAVGDSIPQLGTLPPVTWLQGQFDDNDWSAIASILKRHWWSRVWIIQEALKSRVVEVCCGQAKATLHDFAALEELRHAYGRDVEGMRRIPSYPLAIILSAWQINLRDANSDVCPLYEWMSITHRFAVTDPRDRFYALLGLSCPESRGAIEVEYDKTKLSDDMINVQGTRHFLLQQQRLLPLQACWKKKSRALPSWCPDWYVEQEGYVALVFSNRADDGTPLRQFQACGPYIRNTEFIFKHVGQPPSPSGVNTIVEPTDVANWTFSLAGWVFDSIDYADSFTQFDLSTETTPEKQASGRQARRQGLLDKCTAWQQIVDERMQHERANPYGGPGLLGAAFWRTLVADRDQHWKGPLPEDFGGRLAHFLSRREVDQESLPFLVPAVSRLARRAFIVTQKGYLGLAPEGCRKGDFVCILKGGDVPFVLRRISPPGSEDPGQNLNDLSGKPSPRLPGAHWQWIGESYIHGIMDGEMIAEMRRTQRIDDEKVQFEIN